MATQPETNLKLRAFALLDKIPNTWYYKAQQVALRGIPDIIGCCNGTMFAWELKVDSDKANPLQSFILAQIKNSNGVAEVVNNKNLNQKAEELTQRAFS